ncbi:MAG: hypothetical protein WCH34_09560 [Bacteroidota bacterium]
MDVIQQYTELSKKIATLLPLKALPVRDLVQTFRSEGHPITLKTQLNVTAVMNSGDSSGIVCMVETDDGIKMGCPLTYLVFAGDTPLYKDITHYQVNRIKRVLMLQKAGVKQSFNTLKTKSRFDKS